MFGFFLDKGLISANQWGFKLRDSRINQLLSLTHDIYKSFDDGYEVRGGFHDILKVCLSYKFVCLTNHKKMGYQATY